MDATTVRRRPEGKTRIEAVAEHVNRREHGTVCVDDILSALAPNAPRHITQAWKSAIRQTHAKGLIRRVGTLRYAPTKDDADTLTERIIAHVDANGPCRVREIVAAIAPDAGTQARINIGSMVPQLAKAGRIARIDHNLYDSVRA